MPCGSCEETVEVVLSRGQRHFRILLQKYLKKKGFLCVVGMTTLQYGKDRKEFKG